MEREKNEIIVKDSLKRGKKMQTSTKQKIFVGLISIILLGSILAVVLFASDRPDIPPFEPVVPTPLPRPTQPVNPSDYPPIQ